MRFTNIYVRVQLALAGWWSDLADERRERGDRGDVPGWVLVTIMTAGLVTALWIFAGQKLQEILDEALSNVHG